MMIVALPLTRIVIPDQAWVSKEERPLSFIIEKRNQTATNKMGANKEWFKRLNNNDHRKNGICVNHAVVMILNEVTVVPV